MFDDCRFVGALLTPGFRAHGLPALLTRERLYPADPITQWPTLRAALRAFAATGGPARVLRYVARPVTAALGYRDIVGADPVATRDGPEDGGHLARAVDGACLRFWAVGLDTDLETPPRRGVASGASPTRQTARVLRASGESAGLLTNGDTLAVLLCDPAGPDSQIFVPLGAPSGWVSRDDAPDSFRLLAALASPRGLASLPSLFDAARLHQTEVTKTLRWQARAAIEGFIQAILDRTENAAPAPPPATLWRQSLIIVYRLLFVLKLESAAEPGGGFGFALSDAWRGGLSPNRALGPLARRHLDRGHDTGRMLEDGLRLLFRICRDGLDHPAAPIAPMGGALFGPAATAALDAMPWGERAVAILLDRLLWTTPRGRARERVHYGSLDVEELGRVYESLLDLEPDISTYEQTRLRHGRVEAVVPSRSPGNPASTARAADQVETIAPGRFFLRTGLGRRGGGSYYTPHEFVRFLVRESLSPLVDPAIEAADPGAILRLKIFDPAMGSGHFLVEACRVLADALHEACRRCDAATSPSIRRRLDALGDRDGRLAAWLPSRTADRADTGLARTRALALCRRLVSVRCLYGVDRDPLAVELAKLALWLESFAEGLPLTFLDHRLIAGDSVAAPFFAGLACLPVGGASLDPLLARGVTALLSRRVDAAMAEVATLEASIGTSIADVMLKTESLRRMETLLAPLRALARAWSGAVASGSREANDAWLALARSVAETGAVPAAPHPHQAALLERGATALPLDLTFPEVFRPPEGNGGFDVVLGNPPWDVVHYQTKEYLARFDPSVMDAPTRNERAAIERDLLRDPAIEDGFRRYRDGFAERKRLYDRLFAKAGGTGSIDMFRVFTERMLDCVAAGGLIGLVVPSSLHANEGTAGLRRRFLRETSIQFYFMLENRRRYFDIHLNQKFSLIVARRPGPTRSFRCAFYLDSLARSREPGRVMTYDRDFLAAAGGAHETFPELRGEDDFRLARHLFVGHPDMASWLTARRIVFGREAHMTDDSHRFTPIERIDGAPALPLHEGKTFHQYTDRWKTRPRYAIRADAMTDKPAWLRASAHYRLAFREISRSTDERTMIAAIIPPGHLFGHKGTCEKAPWHRPNAGALILCALFNSFSFDWCVRQKIAASLSLFMLHACPAPELSAAACRFLAHAALRLSCRHGGYEALWREQLGPAVPMECLGAEARESVRAAIDAVAAVAYGLGREDYRHVLTGFSHAANPRAPEQCLAAFDSLRELGEATFHPRHDPFDAIPLVERPAQPTSDSATASPTLIPSMPADRIPPA